MPSQLMAGSIAAPGFNGLNTQDSSITLDSGWAATATNCIIDKYGRIGARKGWEYVTEFVHTTITNSDDYSLWYEPWWQSNLFTATLQEDGSYLVYAYNSPVDPTTYFYAPINNFNETTEFSIDVKHNSGSTSFITIVIGTTGEQNVGQFSVDTITGVVTNNTFPNPITSTSLGDSWFRLTFSVSPPAFNVSFKIWSSATTGTGQSFFLKPITITSSPLTYNIASIFEFKDVDGSITYLCGGVNKLYTTPNGNALTQKNVRNATNTDNHATYTITDNNWQFASLPIGQGVNATGHAYAAQAGHGLLVYNYTAGVFQVVGDTDIGSIPSDHSTIFDPNTVISAYGRLWTAVTSVNKTTVYYSVLLDGTDFTGAGAGLIDVSAVVGNNDEIVSLALHNNFLIIFCKQNIVVYANANDVDNLVLSDVIKGIGCIARDSIQNIGTDILFLSATGLRALSRTIQEKSMPMRELSLNIRDDFVSWVNNEDIATIKSVYSATDAFYLMSLPLQKVIVCFDMKTPAANASAKVTKWNNLDHTAFCAASDGTLLFGQKNGIARYTAYSDNYTPYYLSYYTTYFDLGAPAKLKLLKRIGVTVVGNSDNMVAKYGFDYSDDYTTVVVPLTGVSGSSEFGIAEFNVAEFSGGNQSYSEKKSMNIGGGGTSVQLGFEALISDPLSIQKIDVAAVVGKTLI